jgi:hypothetical protein
MNEGLFCKTERGMFAHTERMGTSSFEQPHNGNYSFLTDLFAILTGCWLAGTVLSLSYHATAGMPLGLSTTAYLILSSLLSGVLLTVTVMNAESARSVIHVHLRAIAPTELLSFWILVEILEHRKLGCSLRFLWLLGSWGQEWGSACSE